MHLTKRSLILVVGLSIALSLAILLIVLGTRSSKLAPPGPDAGAARQLVHDKNLGLGLLENQKNEESIGLFEPIADQLPEEPLGFRNILVARVLALGDDEQPASAAALESAQAALDRLEKLEAGSLAYHWLASKVATAKRDYSLAETHLRAISEKTPDDASVWYALFRLKQLSGQADSQTATKSIEESRRLAPSNLWILVQWLRLIGTQLSEEANSQADPKSGKSNSEALEEQLASKNASLLEQLESARLAIKPIVHEVTTYSRVDPLKLLDGAKESIEQRKWGDASVSIASLANLLLPHSLQDRQAVLRHPLDFTLNRFSPEFYKLYQVDETIAAPPIKVAFETLELLPPESHESLTSPVAAELADFDLDGWLDVVVLTPERLMVFGREDGIGQWRPIASTPVLPGGVGLMVQDFDADFDETGPPGGTTNQVADGAFTANTSADAKTSQPFLCPTADVDVLVFGAAGIQRFENKRSKEDGSRSLEPIPDEIAFPRLEEVSAAIAADIDADGDLDVVAASETGLHLISNNGDWSFTDISSRSSLPVNLTDVGSLVAADWDRDVDIDVLVASPSGGGWLENLRHGQFRWNAFEAGWSPIKSAKALELVDVNGDASWDVLSANPEGIELLQTQNAAPGVLRPTSNRKISLAPAGSVSVWDYDNDGLDDLLAWGSQKVSVLRGLPEGKFELVNLLPQMADGLLQCRAADLDNDRDLDLLLVSKNQLHFFENRGGNANHSIDVALQGQQIKGQQLSASGRVTPQGIGSLMELKAGERYQPRIVRSQRTHFGLGQQRSADVIRVTWLNGVPQNIIQPAADLFVCEQQVLNTSCPYLYAWNGKRFEFVTDLLWNAPLGLQLEAGVLAPAREWEYLKISGDQLAPLDGHYVLQFTEELWEVAYVDQVRLIAIDHPEEVQIFSNEKVGSAEMAAYKVHTARSPRPPVSAVNQRGRDLLPDLKSQDGVYARVFDKKLQQGLVEESHLELDLGDIENTKQVTLFLTGWVYPAATSMNVAMTSNSLLLLPKPPSLSVSKDGQTWREVLPFMGFPGGKTKTIAIDLSQVLEPGDHLVRIVTTMEFYWDQVFFTVDEAQVEIQETPLELVSADLHYRGFSRVVRDDTDGPEQFLYGEVSTQQKWPPMIGKLTAFGDVTELLRESDHQQVVIAAGDEVTLHFAVPSKPLLPGWKRDFFLHNIGWEKDANLHTVLGSTVEPLPYLGMAHYPFPSEQDPRNESAEYRRYLNRYQTRDCDSSFWKSINGRGADADRD